jgi:general stress protein YciG
MKSSRSERENGDEAMTKSEGKQRRGFASMSSEKQREIASKGGRAAHVKGTAHEWTPDEARSAGRKGAQATRDGRGRPAAPGEMTPHGPPALSADTTPENGEAMSGQMTPDGETRDNETRDNETRDGERLDSDEAPGGGFSMGEQR